MIFAVVDLQFAVISLQFSVINLQLAVIDLQFAVIDLQNVGLLWNDLQPIILTRFCQRVAEFWKIDMKSTHINKYLVLQHRSYRVNDF